MGSICDNVMSVARSRCPDCGEALEVPFNWCTDPQFRGFTDERGRTDPGFAALLLLEHARQTPILHPTVLPEHHLMRRPA